MFDLNTVLNNDGDGDGVFDNYGDGGGYGDGYGGVLSDSGGMIGVYF